MNFDELTLLLFMSIAVGTDLCDGKVYNKWVVTGALCAQVLLFKDVFMGRMQWHVCIDKLIGMLLPVAILMVFFSLGMIGGGDVKLFSMIGAFLGWKGVALCMMLSSVPAVTLAFGKMIFQGSFGKRFRYLHLYLKKTVLSGKVTIYEREPAKEGTICLSVPILIGVWLYINKR